MLSQPQNSKELQKARLQAIAGQYEVAIKIFDSLFHEEPPTPELSLDYWSAKSNIPGQEQIAYEHLQQLYDFAKTHELIQRPLTPYSWTSNLVRTLSRLSVKQAKKYLLAKQFSQAEKLFQLAADYNPENDDAWLGLGDIAFEYGKYDLAEQDYKKAYSIDSTGTSAVYGLVSIYKRKSPQKAIDYLNTLPQALKDRTKDALLNLESSLLQNQAEKLESKKQLKLALDKYIQAQKKEPQDIWINYHVANLYFQLGQKKQADNQFNNLIKNNNKNPLFYYAKGLYLSNTDRDSEALSFLNQLNHSLWTKDIKDLAERLQLGLTIKQAQTLRDQGKIKEANEYLLKQPYNTRIRLLLADWAYQDKHYVQALDYFHEIKAKEPDNADARLGEIETLIALNKLQEAHELLSKDHIIEADNTLNMQRRLAIAWYGVNELARANSILQQLKIRAKKEPRSQNTALVFRDAADLEVKLDKPKDATSDYKTAMVDSGITTTYPEGNDNYTYLTRLHKDDDWLKKGIRRSATRLYKQQETKITLDQDIWRLLNGTGGVSDYTIKATFAQIEHPLWGGKAFYRNDYVDLNAGTFDTTNNVFFDNFGTCTRGCSSEFLQRASGYGVAAGWINDHWNIDVGSTPLGFNVSNAVGGIGYNNKLGDLGWTLLFSRRAMWNSLLSYSGTRDPNTGLVWGGVVASGANLSFSYDLGQSYGLWSNLGVAELTGKNVASNFRARLMDGYYYRWINEDNRIATVGLNTMIWHYQRDLGGYSLGQGGYFSPQFYLSLALPAYYRQRTENWSYEVGGNFNYSWTIVHDSVLYPLTNLVPQPFIQDNSIIVGSNSSGLGYSLLAMVERRLTSHWVIGAVVDYQQSTNYTPSHASLYIRYSLEGWNGDMSMPIQPLIPYANF